MELCVANPADGVRQDLSPLQGCWHLPEITQAKAWARILPRPFGPKPAPKSDTHPGLRKASTLGALPAPLQGNKRRRTERQTPARPIGLPAFCDLP
jgi:hypothetical protein